MTKYDVIKKYIDEYDYYGLLKSGAPNDEFDIESRALYYYISTHYTIEEIAIEIAKVFEIAFGGNNKPEQFMETAQKIKNAFIENNITD